MGVFNKCTILLWVREILLSIHKTARDDWERLKCGLTKVDRYTHRKSSRVSRPNLIIYLTLKNMTGQLDQSYNMAKMSQ